MVKRDYTAICGMIKESKVRLPNLTLKSLLTGAIGGAGAYLYSDLTNEPEKREGAQEYDDRRKMRNLLFGLGGVAGGTILGMGDWQNNFRVKKGNDMNEFLNTKFASVAEQTETELYDLHLTKSASIGLLARVAGATTGAFKGGTTAVRDAVQTIGGVGVAVGIPAGVVWHVLDRAVRGRRAKEESQIKAREYYRTAAENILNERGL